MNALAMRRRTIRYTLLLTVVATFAAMAISQPAAQGVLIGGVTGAIAFWIMARQMDRVTQFKKEMVPALVYRSTFIRLGLYAIALGSAAMLDTQNMHGLLGALAGISIGYAVLIVVGITK